MLVYSELLNELLSLADETYRAFHAKLLANAAVKNLGVRTPNLRRLAKKYRGELLTLLTFPDDIYEVTFLKCAVLGLQPYEIFTAHLEELLLHVDNWATCDCFEAPCVKGHRAEFLEHIKKFRGSEHEFVSRYALVSLLRYYPEEEYLPVVFESVEGSDHEKYYVMMAAAWLTAEVLVRHYREGLAFLKRGTLPPATHNRAIQKACESFRLSPMQKSELRALKRAVKK